jgi:hypothetical protein
MERKRGAAMSAEPESNGPLAASEEDEELEIVVEVTEDQQVALSQGEWGILLSVEEARLLGEALMDAADDAENGVE